MTESDKTNKTVPLTTHLGCVYLYFFFFAVAFSSEEFLGPKLFSGLVHKAGRPAKWRQDLNNRLL